MNIPITKENEGLYKRFKEIVTIQGRQLGKTLSTIEQMKYLEEKHKDSGIEFFPKDIK